MMGSHLFHYSRLNVLAFSPLNVITPTETLKVTSFTLVCLFQ